MKKLLILSAAAVFLAACSKDKNPVDPTVEDSQITLTLKGTLPPTAPSANITSKSTGAIPTQTADNTVGSIMIFVFNTATQNIDKIKVATPAEVTAKQVGVTASSGARDIYVVVNYPASSQTALSNVTSVSGLKAIYADLKNENEGNFCMIGNQLNKTIAASPATNNITVVVSRLAARVTLANITTNFTGGLLSGISIDSVYIINATGTKSYGDSSIVVSPATVYNRTQSGMTFPLYDSYTVPAVVTNATPYTTTVLNGNHFYVYANAANTYAGATKLVITGLLNGTRTYYPIAINVAGNGYTPTGTPGIAANSQYSITVTLKGFGNPATDPGYLNQIQPATATITVTPANWHTVINQNVDF